MPRTTSPAASKAAATTVDSSPRRLHVFLSLDVDQDHLVEAAEDLLDAAQRRLRRSGLSARVLRVSPLARSVLVEADPAILDIVPTMPRVVDTLATDLTDVFPRPAERHSVD